MDKTSGQPRVNLSLLRSNSLKFQPQNMSCMPIMPQPFKNFLSVPLHGKMTHVLGPYLKKTQAVKFSHKITVFKWTQY